MNIRHKKTSVEITASFHMIATIARNAVRNFSDRCERMETIFQSCSDRCRNDRWYRLQLCLNDSSHCCYHMETSLQRACKTIYAMIDIPKYYESWREYSRSLGAFVPFCSDCGNRKVYRSGQVRSASEVVMIAQGFFCSDRNDNTETNFKKKCQLLLQPREDEG